MIQAKLETGKIIDELREKLQEASPAIKAKLETDATLSKIIDELREQFKEASPEI